MAGRNQSFLEPEERAKLSKELQLRDARSKIRGRGSARSRKRKAAAVAEMKAAMHNPGLTEDGEQLSGCFVCKLDNDHPNLLLCEGCNGEYHTYCLTPKLKAIPRGDWYCGTLRELLE
jgi:hypothetical protein